VCRKISACVCVCVSISKYAILGNRLNGEKKKNEENLIKGAAK